MNDNAWIDPNLLQIIGLGTKADPYLVDGRHLRWFSARLLGFPRSGYRLLRTPSPLDWNAKLLQGQGVLKTESMRKDQFEASPPAQFRLDGRRLVSGLSVRRAGGLAYRQIYANVSPFLQVDSTPVRLDFGPEAAEAASFGQPRIVNPAAYVYLIIIRRRRTGSVVATASYDAAGEYRFQDRTAIGSGLRPWLPPSALPDVIAFEDGFMLRSSAECQSDAGTLRRRDRRAARDLFGRRVLPSSASGVGSSRPDSSTVDLTLPPILRGADVAVLDRFRNLWVVEGLLLHGGLIDHVEVRGHDAVIAQVQWIPTRTWAADADRWTEVDRFFLPLTDAPAIYPTWTMQPGINVAAQRLAATPPRALPPWDEPTQPPPPATPGDVELDLKRRYLEPGFARVDEMLREILTRELTEVRPQAEIMVTSKLDPDPTRDEGVRPVDVTFSPYDVMMSHAIDPQMARLLGLMTTDGNEPDGAFDYLVEADFPRLWIQVATNRSAFEAALKQLRRQFDGRPLPWAGQPGEPPIGLNTTLGHGMRTQRCISVATAIERSAVALPHPPSAPQVTVTPQPVARPVQADVFVGWALPAVNLFEDPLGVRVFYALRRQDDQADIALHESDDDTDVLLAHVPTGEMASTGGFRLHDRRLQRYGNYRYRLSAMDLFGRFSPFADVETTVADLVAPPPPAVVECEVLGSDADAPVWPTVEVRFRWSAGQAELAPDLERFRVFLRHGRVSFADGLDLATWAGIEHQPGVTTSPIEIDASLLQPLPVGPTPIADPPALSPTVSVATVAEADGGGHQVVLRCGPVTRPYDDEGYAHVSATVVAEDNAGNTSAPARRVVATRVDPGTPPTPVHPAEPQDSSFPDARARAFFRIPLGSDIGLLPSTYAQVWRSTQSVLLAQATVAQQDEFATADDSIRAGLLRTLAIDHPELFSVDHARPYDHTVPEHWIELNGNDDALTVATTRTIGRTGVRSPWPSTVDAFVVIRVPRIPTPPIPLVESVRAGDRAVEIQIAPDPSRRTRAFRIYRGVAEPGALPDVRRLRPVATLEALDTPPESVGFIDDGLLADVPYVYRVQALGTAGARSEATDAIEVRPWSSLPPDPGTVLNAIRPGPASSIRIVAFRVPRRDYATTLLRLPGDALRWQVAVGPDDLRLRDMGGTNDGTGWQFQIEDDVGAEAADTRFSYALVLRDPRGRTATSDIVAEGT